MESSAPLPPPPPPPPSLLSSGRVGDESDDNRFQRKPLQRLISVRLVPLHHCSAPMLEAVNQLLSERWPKTDRSSSQIQNSCDAFPVSLVMLEEGGDGVDPLGHVLLSKCVEDPAGLVAESVLVASCLRGGGMGRRLMELMHSYAKSRGFGTIYLSTRDKRDFYAHLGYVLCEPVSLASAVTAGEDRSNAMLKLKDVFGGAGSKFLWMKLKL